jgi:hypothetical protein
MVNPGFVLFPLYIYPGNNAWQPLFDAATANPSLIFQAVVNVNSGPGSDPCPNSDYINALDALNSYANIRTLAYVHTASRYDCGPNQNWICPATRDLSALEAEITTYQNWSNGGCAAQKDIHIGGIFFDEAPTTPDKIDYMRNITTFARNTLTNGNTILFNAGVQVDPGYWAIADFINVFENTEAAYDVADIGALDGNGIYSHQASLIIHSYTDDISTLKYDVDTIMNFDKDGIAGLYITDVTMANNNPYNSFPKIWAEFCKIVAEVVQKNTVFP